MKKMYEIEYGNDEYPYHVMIYSVVKGKLYYAGIGKFCRSIDEINEYIVSEGFEKMEGVFSKHGYV